jgi:hypothetical protein
VPFRPVPGKILVNVYISSEVRKRVDVIAIIEGMTLSDLVEKALKQYMESIDLKFTYKKPVKP